LKIFIDILAEAVEQKIITTDQSEKLNKLMIARQSANTVFDFTNAFYFLGACIAISSMTVFIAIGFEFFGNIGVLNISCMYLVLSLCLMRFLYNKNMLTLLGITGAYAVSVTPIIAYSFLDILGLWSGDGLNREHHLKNVIDWVAVELSALLIGFYLVSKYRVAFIMMPVSISLWFCLFDMLSIVFGDDNNFRWRPITLISVGIFITLLARYFDKKHIFSNSHKIDFTFWLYLVAAISIWLGVTKQYIDSDNSKALYFVINIFMLLLGVLIERRIFAVLGSIGICVYLSNLAYSMFSGSWVFPFTISLLGLLVIYIGVLWNKYKVAIISIIKKLSIK